MKPNTSDSTKMKITASLDSELVEKIDQYLNESNIRSRSRLIETILRNWYEQEKSREIERQTEAYYRSLSEDEQEEDRNWGAASAKSAEHLWED